MFTKNIEKIAREGVFKGFLENMGVDSGSIEAKAMVAVNIHLQPIIQKKLESVNSATNLPELMGESISEAFDLAAQDFRESGDWEAFGVVKWMKGASGLPR